MYAFLARENGFKITSTEIFAMFRDWSESRSLGSKDYPKTSCMRIPVEMWPHEKTREFIKERLRHIMKGQGGKEFSSRHTSDLAEYNIAARCC